MKKFISILFCIAIFLLYFIFEINMNFSSAFSEKNIKNMTKNITFVANTKPEDVTPEDLYFQSALDTVYDMADTYDIPKEKVEDLLESDYTKNFINKYISDLSSSIINGTDSMITNEDLGNYLKDEVKEYLKNNSDINNNDKENIYNFVDQNAKTITSKLPSTTQITNNINPNILNFIQTFFSSNTKILLMGIIVGSIFIILLLQFKNNKWLLYIGSVIAISTIVNLILSFMINPLISILINYNSNFVVSIIKSLSSSIVNSYLITNIVGLIISIIILIIYNLSKRKNAEI